MAKKIILYLFGVVLGIFLVRFLFGGRNIACNYFPEGRVIDNLKKKEVSFTEFSECQLSQIGIKKESIDSLLSVSKVHFSESKIRGMECPEYVLSTRSTSATVHMVIRNCENEATVLYIDTAKTASVRCP
ncbi:hypothetical protein [Thermaurantimonas aggregans]|uniref:hypothetical protein n=1 Tax=Thermaurantimonas aggregans TaxID=2173829 RepID=UPI0023F09DCB|nr:hypothetical protein [Thermaurantimonas aggregans]MCX8149461.1 hypothetical protein [Thermaurantimonas aggregans]